jgi:hypothetical protein
VPAYFGRSDNIGVLLGEPSRGLIDCDLDHFKAISLAEQYLPRTAAVFGRARKPQSHWLYCVDRPIPTTKRQSKTLGMIAELRSTGCQTVFPGSVHPSGESIDWHIDGEPALLMPRHSLTGSTRWPMKWSDGTGLQTSCRQRCDAVNRPGVRGSE